MDKIENGSYETVQMRVVDACVMPNNRLLASNHQSISILDERFNIIKEIEKMDGNFIESYGVAFNNKKNCIYVSCYHSHCIYMLDLDLNKIKSFGSHGSNNNNLDCPSGICLNDDYLYVCDTLNFRIQILNSDLQYIDMIDLSFYPQTTRCIGATMGIAGLDADNGDHAIEFYDLNTKELKKKHDNLYGKLNRIDSLFYFVSDDPTRLYCFNTDGNKIKEIKISRFEGLIPIDTNLLYFDNSLIMTNGSKSLIKFL